MNPLIKKYVRKLAWIIEQIAMIAAGAVVLYNSFWCQDEISGTWLIFRLVVGAICIWTGVRTLKPP